MKNDNKDDLMLEFTENPDYKRSRFSACDLEGCGVETSPPEWQALVDFYDKTNGDFWINNYKWKQGDPCIENWYGVQCNKYGNVISLHFFENSLDGVIPDSIKNLKYLIYFNIFNDNWEYEYTDNYKRNTIYQWNKNIHQISSLEEINFVNLDMTGFLDSSLNNLRKLKKLNL